MYIFILFLFVYSLESADPTKCSHGKKSYGPVTYYIGADKTAQLLNIIQKMRQYEKSFPLRTKGEEKTEIHEPDMIESMKLLQKNYDTSRKFNKDLRGRHINLQYISNPEVFEAYRSLPARRNEGEDKEKNEPRLYGEEAMDMSKRPNNLLDLRKYNKPSTSSSDSDSEDSDSSDDDDDDSDDDSRRKIVHFRVDQNLVVSTENSEDAEEVTLKPEEAFDIVKPFIVEIFNKLKEKENEAKTDNDDFYDPKKVPTSDEGAVKVVNLDIKDMTTMIPEEYVPPSTTAQDTEIYNYKNDDRQTNLKDNQAKQLLNNENDVEVKDSWRKKEKLKNMNIGENISEEKNSKSIEKKSRDDQDDDDWKGKRLPASKKSFVEPTFAHGWDDKGYGYWKKTNWDRKGEKDALSEEKHKKSDDFGSHLDKKFSKEEKNMNDNKKSKKTDEKEDDLDKKKIEWSSHYLKNYDDYKIESKKDDWDSPKHKKDKWDDPKGKIDDWDDKKSKNDKWDEPKSKIDKWDDSKSKKEKWDSPKSKKDSWETKHKNDDDWDKKQDSWNKKDNSWNKKDKDWNKGIKTTNKLPDNKKRDSAWDMVGIENNKKSAEKPYQKKSVYSEWGNYETLRNKKGNSYEKDDKKDDFKEDFKPVKKADWDSYAPKISKNYDRPKKSMNYDSYERRPANSAFGGHTSIPMVGKKGIYAD